MKCKRFNDSEKDAPEGLQAWFYDKNWIYFAMDNKTKSYGMH